MHIPGRHFVDTIMWTSVASELKWDANIKKSHLRQAELKVMRLLDTIFSKFSATYRLNRTLVKNKISYLMEETRRYHEQAAHVQKASEKVFSNSNKEKVEEESYDLSIFEEPEDFYRKPEVVQSKNDNAQPSLEQKGIQSEEERDPEQLIEEPQVQNEDQEIEDQNSALDEQATQQDDEVESQVTEESVDHQIESYIPQAVQQEKLVVEPKSQELAPVEQIQHYLEENPAAVETASEICQQMIVSSWDEAFGGLEPDVLTTFNPDVERAAATYNAQLPLQVREWLRSKAFKKDISENLGTLAGFFLILRSQLQAGNVGTVIKIFQAMNEQEEIDFWTTEQEEAAVKQEDVDHLSIAPDAQDAETREVENKFKEGLIEILNKETKVFSEAFKDLDVEELTRPQTKEELKLEKEREAIAKSFNQARAEADALYHKEQKTRALLFQALSDLDVEELTRPQTEEELQLEKEREVKIQAYEEEKFLTWLKSNEFKRNLIANPVMLAGVLILVQTLYREGAMHDLYRVLKAIGWDTEESSAFSLDEIVEMADDLKENAKDTNEAEEKKLGDE